MNKNIYSLGIFKGIKQETVNEIIEQAPTKKIKKGELLIIEGSQNNKEAYIIKSGKVKVSISGKKIVELGIGNIVGEIALLNEESRTATVEALEDSEVFIINFDNLIEMINNDDNSINKEIIRRIEENLKYS